MLHVVQQFGLFKFQTDQLSRPGTPTASARSKAAIFGLDAISRNLFSGRSGGGDLFSGSTNASHRRSRTVASRASTYTDTTTTADSTLTRFSRSNSSFAATTISSMGADDKSVAGLSISIGSVGTSASARSKDQRPRKLTKAGRSSSVGGSESDSDGSRSPRRGGGYSSDTIAQGRYRENGEPSMFEMDESERDLAMRLELARQNSQHQHAQQPYLTAFPTMHSPIDDRKHIDLDDYVRVLIRFDAVVVEDTSYLHRPLSRASREPTRPGSVTPTKASTSTSETSSVRHARSLSRHSSDRPRGPRTPSPLPPPHSPAHSAQENLLPPEFESTSERAQRSTSSSPTKLSPLPRSKRQPFEPMGNASTSEKVADIQKEDEGEEENEDEEVEVEVEEKKKGKVRPASVVEPLSIKKKTFVQNEASTSGTRRMPSMIRNPPNVRVPSSTSRKSSAIRISRIPKFNGHTGPVAISAQSHRDAVAIVELFQATKEDVSVLTTDGLRQLTLE